MEAQIAGGRAAWVFQYRRGKQIFAKSDDVKVRQAGRPRCFTFATEPTVVSTLLSIKRGRKVACALAPPSPVPPLCLAEPSPSQPKFIGMWKSDQSYVPTKLGPMRASAECFSITIRTTCSIVFQIKRHSIISRIRASAHLSSVIHQYFQIYLFI